MKSFLILGAGMFAHHLCRALSSMGAEIMLADASEEAMEDLLPYVVSARICDCTNADVLRSFGVGNFDACFVCMGEEILDSLEITDILHDLGARKIICHAVRDNQVKFLLRNGADYVVYPDKDVAEQIAISESSDDIFNTIQLAHDYYVFEIRIQDMWVGKTLRSLDFRNKYHLNIIGLKTENDIQPVIDPDFVFPKDRHLMVVGHIEDVRRIVRE